MIFKKWIFTSLSPNTEPDDVFRALGCIVQPWAWREGRAQGVLKEEIKSYLGGGEVSLFSSGRGALASILAALNLKEGDEVVVQAYTCVAVPNAVLWAGLKPVYADIDPKTFNISPDSLQKKVTSHTKAVVVQHTFGIPADLDKILAIATKHKLMVIEDLAHALGATYQGRPVGAFGDAAFLSFGRDKALSSVFGGAAVAHNKALAENLRIVYSSLPHPSRVWILQQLIHPAVLTISKSLYGVFGLGRVILGLARFTGVISKAVYPQEKNGGRPAWAVCRMPEALARLAGAQFEKLSRFVTRRRAIVEIYQSELGALSDILPASPASSAPSYLRFPLRVQNASDIIREARANSIELGDWYNVPVAPMGVTYQKVLYEEGSCPEAEKAAKESLNLPTHIGIREEDARTIIAFLKRYHVGS
ncbi:MAG: aminotransferase class I/II-fold pyridoxal phosphate-dependent enzyme [Patescibacteria group bacterium]